jgi:hypothetical protein
MAEEILNEMITHLEFLGYGVVQEEGSIWATHPKYINLVFSDFGFGILFKAFFAFTEEAKDNRAEVLEMVNQFNFQASLCKAYVDDDFDLALEACFPRVYDKTAFGVFIDSLNTDVRLIFEEEINLHTYLK